MFDMPAVKPTSISIISYRKMGKGIYDISATISKDNRDEVADAFRVATKGRMALVSGTYRLLPAVGDTRCRFAARPTVTFKPYADCASMVSMGNGEFVDTAENIWNVLQDGDERHLILQSQDDMDDILEQFKSRKRLSVNASHMSHEVRPVAGDFAAVIDDDGVLTYGFVGQRDQATVLYDSVAREVKPVDTARVVESIYLGDVPDGKPMDTAKLQSSDLTKIWEYLSKIYPPEYIAKYKAAVGA